MLKNVKKLKIFFNKKKNYITLLAPLIPIIIFLHFFT